VKAESTSDNVREVEQTKSNLATPPPIDATIDFEAKSGEHADVHRPITVWWNLDEEWYSGVVRSLDDGTGMSDVHYFEDGEEEMMDIRGEVWRYLPDWEQQPGEQQPGGQQPGGQQPGEQPPSIMVPRTAADAQWLAAEEGLQLLLADNASGFRNVHPSGCDGKPFVAILGEQCGMFDSAEAAALAVARKLGPAACASATGLTAEEDWLVTAFKELEKGEPLVGGHLLTDDSFRRLVGLVQPCPKNPDEPPKSEKASDNSARKPCLLDTALHPSTHARLAHDSESEEEESVAVGDEEEEERPWRTPRRIPRPPTGSELDFVGRELVDADFKVEWANMDVGTKTLAMHCEGCKRSERGGSFYGKQNSHAKLKKGETKRSLRHTNWCGAFRKRAGVCCANLEHTNVQCTQLEAFCGSGLCLVHWKSKCKDSGKSASDVTEPENVELPFALSIAMDGIGCARSHESENVDEATAEPALVPCEVYRAVWESMDEEMQQRNLKCEGCRLLVAKGGEDEEDAAELVKHGASCTLLRENKCVVNGASGHVDMQCSGTEGFCGLGFCTKHFLMSETEVLDIDRGRWRKRKEEEERRSERRARDEVGFLLSDMVWLAEMRQEAMEKAAAVGKEERKKNYQSPRIQGAARAARAAKEAKEAKEAAKEVAKEAGKGGKEAKEAKGAKEAKEAKGAKKRRREVFGWAEEREESAAERVEGAAEKAAGKAGLIEALVSVGFSPDWAARAGDTCSPFQGGWIVEDVEVELAPSIDTNTSADAAAVTPEKGQEGRQQIENMEPLERTYELWWMVKKLNSISYTTRELSVVVKKVLANNVCVVEGGEGGEDALSAEAPQSYTMKVKVGVAAAEKGKERPPAPRAGVDTSAATPFGEGERKGDPEGKRRARGEVLGRRRDKEEDRCSGVEL